MRAVVQRVVRGSVSVEGVVLGAIGTGLVVLLGVSREDDEGDAGYLAEKIANLRIFEDHQGKLNLSLLDINGAILVVSQFTLLGDCRQGRRPSFSEAAPPGVARVLYEKFVVELKRLGLQVVTGSFKTHMVVEILNNGPVTLLLDSKKVF